MIKVKSSNIESYKYDAGGNKLHVKFKASGTYIYERVPQRIADGLAEAKSFGQYFALHVKGKFSHTKV